MIKDYFRDFRHPPTQEDIRIGLGEKVYPLWERMIFYVESNTYIAGELTKLGPAEVGWGWRYRLKRKTLVTLYPGRDMFTALVVMGKEQAERAQNLTLGEKVAKLLRETPQLRDGRWLMIPVFNAQDVEDILQLLHVKMRSTRTERKIIIKNE